MGEDSTVPVERRRTKGVAAVAALAVAMMILLVFPGFWAAMLSKTGELYLLRRSPTQQTWVILRIDAMTPLVDAALEPARQLMDRSERVRDFYLWQYQLAGGEMSH